MACFNKININLKKKRIKHHFPQKGESSPTYRRLYKASENQLCVCPDAIKIVIESEQGSSFEVQKKLGLIL